MSWKLREKYRRRLSEEEGESPKGWGGKINICLIYPNRYYTAMSNLGFQAVHALLNSQPDILCERAFLPEPDEVREYQASRTPLLSLESQRPLIDFDVIAFSVSFETDYLNLPVLFELMGVPALAAERDASFPLIIGGGAALFLNPEPVADFLDLIFLGEAEPLLPALLELVRGQGGREEIIRHAAVLSGVYVPSMYHPRFEGVTQKAFDADLPARIPISRQWQQELRGDGAVSRILSPGTEFSDMYLMEVSRGCPRGCRFCAAGFIYHPYRQHPLEAMKRGVEEGLRHRGKIGLVGAAVSDYRGIGDLCRHIIESGGKVSVSSLRIDALDDEMIGTLIASGHKTVALAPEGGSQRLRDLVKKGITEEQILTACSRLIARDILNLKLYFIIGLPTETDEDLSEMMALVAKIRERVVEAARKNRRLGEVVLSVNPFVPKPFTPFQWCGMEDIRSIEKKAAFLHRQVGRLSNVRLKIESPKEAYIQALLSRGDRRLSAFLLAAHKEGNWRRGARSVGLDTDSFVYREVPTEELLPWDFIEGVPKTRLLEEYRRAIPASEA